VDFELAPALLGDLDAGTYAWVHQALDSQGAGARLDEDQRRIFLMLILAAALEGEAQ
jgi:hypothetical protein